MSVVVKAWKNFTWYVGEIMGDSAYKKYVAHHQVRHPDEPPMSEREFWRSKVEFDESNHSTGCC